VLLAALFRFVVFFDPLELEEPGDLSHRFPTK
jgi:hypothetical protein